MAQPTCKVAMYCRVASHDQIAADNQINRLRRFAEERGMNDLSAYVDNGYSGLNFDRPAFARLDKDIQAGDVRAVIALDQSRIARNHLMASGWAENMKEKGVKVIYSNRADNYVQAMIQNSLSTAWRNKKSPRSCGRKIT